MTVFSGVESQLRLGAKSQNSCKLPGTWYSYGARRPALKFQPGLSSPCDPRQVEVLGLGLISYSEIISLVDSNDLAGVQGFCDHRAAESETLEGACSSIVGGAESPSFTSVLENFLFSLRQ